MINCYEYGEGPLGSLSSRRPYTKELVSSTNWIENLKFDMSNSNNHLNIFLPPLEFCYVLNSTTIIWLIYSHLSQHTGNISNEYTIINTNQQPCYFSMGSDTNINFVEIFFSREYRNYNIFWMLFIWNEKLLPLT